MTNHLFHFRVFYCFCSYLWQLFPAKLGWYASFVYELMIFILRLGQLLH